MSNLNYNINEASSAYNATSKINGKKFWQHLNTDEAEKKIYFICKCYLEQNCYNRNIQTVKNSYNLQIKMHRFDGIDSKNAIQSEL